MLPARGRYSQLRPDMLFQVKVVDPHFGRQLGRNYKLGRIDEETVVEAVLQLSKRKSLKGEPWKEKNFRAS